MMRCALRCRLINHLQDCGKDYRDLDRVYVPQDALAASGAQVSDLGAGRATPALRDWPARPRAAHRQASRPEHVVRASIRTSGSRSKSR